MQLACREGKKTDFEEWFAMRCADEPGWRDWRGNLQREWNVLFDSGEFLSVVMEDADGLEGHRMLAFGGGAFVSDGFTGWLRDGQPPCIILHLASHAAAGTRPLLNRAEIACANAADGLNFLLSHWTWAEAALNEVESLRMRVLLAENFHLLHGGYNLRTMLVEGVGSAHRERSIEAGFDLWNDYACHYTRSGNAPEPAELPFLMGVTREDALRKDGSAMCRSFLYTRPRFRFTDGEQKFLCKARSGSDDAELTLRLALSPSMIKKRWREIYEKVNAVLPDLLPPECLDKKRGKERKRLLLDYLRHHPEELRPYKVPVLEVPAKSCARFR